MHIELDEADKAHACSAAFNRSLPKDLGSNQCLEGAQRAYTLAESNLEKARIISVVLAARVAAAQKGPEAQEKSAEKLYQTLLRPAGLRFRLGGMLRRTLKMLKAFGFAR